MTMQTQSWDELADAIVTHDAELQRHAWTPECAAPAFRLADITVIGQVDPAMNAVEEILQLRHDVDDHALAVTLLRGYRPDFTVEQIGQWIDELIHRADNVYGCARATDGERQFALDYYEQGLATFLGGRR